MITVPSKSPDPDPKRGSRQILGICALALSAVLAAPLAGTAQPGAATPPDSGTAAVIAKDLLALSDQTAATMPSATGAGADAAANTGTRRTEEAPVEPVEILVLFSANEVAPGALGDPERAALSLKAAAEGDLAHAEEALSALEDSGRITVLNRFWVTSGILVSAVPTEENLAALASLPGATEILPNFTVEPLDAEEFIPMAEPSITAEAADADGVPVTYGLEKIGAPQTWIDFDAEGQGIRVAVLDTGVDASHPDLAGRVVGSGLGDPTHPGGWISFDRTGTPVVSRPSDPGSHGTHVAATILGGSASGTRVGVAPQAQLMAANVLSGGGGGSIAKIMAGIQWAIQPFDAYGNPAGRPADVVNMSLGSSGYDTTFIPLVRNLRDAGIFPAIAIGNAPCGPNGTSSPGDIYEAFGVGMTNSDDEVDPGSCGAVTSWPSSVAQQYDWPASFVKPDASAPGARVFSAMPGGLWGESTGTSMATPHVAGAVALIRSAQAGLSVDQIERALEDTAWHPDATTAPDPGYGAGRIDVHAAVASLLGQSGVNGTVRDATSAEPVAGATISFAERGETWTTDAQGRFTARLEPGSYTFAAERFGYDPARSTAVVVREDAFAEVEIEMTAITVGAITGIVVDTTTGVPIRGAQIQVMGQPITATTETDGSYRLTGLPVDSYRISAAAESFGTLVSDPAEVRAALETTVNFRLAPLQRALVIGDGGRTADLLSANGFFAESTTGLPGDLDAADYDIIVWDSPDTVPEERVREFSAQTDASGTGVIWLDQGSSELSGIAQLSRATGNPAQREGRSDRTLASVGYRVLEGHEILAPGTVSTDTIGVGDLIVQNATAGLPRFYAWFEGLTGDGVVIVAETVTSEGSGADRVVTAHGDGIAVVERRDSRHVLLALHASSPAVDVRTWPLPTTQVFLNALSWAAPEATQAPPPQIIVPEPPLVDPGEPGGGSTQQPTPAPAPSPASPQLRAPASQIAPKPNTVPDAPFGSADDLTESNRGGISLRAESGIAYITIPDSEPGDWFFLHVYPSRTPVDWIRVNDDGELRIDITRLGGGTYLFAFTDEEGTFAGWAEIVIPSSATAEEVEEAVVEQPDIETGPAETVSPGLTLSPAEQLMLLGAGLLIIAAAAVVLAASRRRPLTPAASESTSDV